MWQPGALWRKKSSVRRRARNSARKTTRNGSVWLDDDSSRDPLGAGVDDPAREAASTALSPSFKTLFCLCTSSASSSSRRTDLFARVLPRPIACPSRTQHMAYDCDGTPPTYGPRRLHYSYSSWEPLHSFSPEHRNLHRPSSAGGPERRPRALHVQGRSSNRWYCRSVRVICSISIGDTRNPTNTSGLGVRPTRIVITGMYLRPRTDAEHTFMRMRLTITAGASAPDRDPIVVSTHSPNPRTETRTSTQFTVMLRSCPAESTSHGSKQAARPPPNTYTTPLPPSVAPSASGRLQSLRFGRNCTREPSEPA